MGDAENDLFQEAEAHLAKCPSTVVPINDIDHVIFGDMRADCRRRDVDAMDVVKDDEMGREIAFVSIMVLFVEIGIIDIEEGGARTGEIVLETAV